MARPVVKTTTVMRVSNLPLSTGQKATTKNRPVLPNLKVRFVKLSTLS